MQLSATLSLVSVFGRLTSGLLLTLLTVDSPFPGQQNHSPTPAGQGQFYPFAASEARAEWATVAPTVQPVTSFAATERAAEVASASQPAGQL